MVDEIERNGPQKKVAISYLLRELGKAEGKAFETLRHEFKQTVLTALSDTEEQKRRLEAWDNLFDQWQVAGGKSRDRAKVISWLRNAIQSQRLGGGPLPAFPEFEQEPEKDGASPGYDLFRLGTPSPVAQDVDWPKWKIEQMVSITRKPVAKSLPGPEPNVGLLTLRRASSVPREPTAGNMGKSSDSEITAVSKSRVRQAVTGRAPNVGSSPAGILAKSPRGEVLAEMVPPHAVIPFKVAKVSPTPGTPDLSPERVTLARDRSLSTPRQTSPASHTAPYLDSGKPRVAEVAPKEPEETSPQIAATRPREKLPRNGHFPAAPPTAAAPPVAVQPVAVQPVETALPPVAALPDRGPSPFASMDRTPTKKPLKSPSVNLQKLNTLVRGYNLAVKELENTLDAPREWNARNLTPLVAQLRDLTQRERDLRIFEQLVPEDEHEYMEEIVALNPTITRIASAIYKARNRAIRRESGSSRLRAREIQDLQDLSRQLARLATGR